MTRSVQLYHVTHRDHVRPILMDRLRPHSPNGRNPRVWLCDRKRLPWALAHVAQSHGWPPEVMRVLGVRARPYRLMRARPGVYWTHRPLLAQGVIAHEPV
jgi:hypothetical protein